jgi:hypothetical protein
MGENSSCSTLQPLSGEFSDRVEFYQRFLVSGGLHNFSMKILRASNPGFVTPNFPYLDTCTRARAPWSEELFKFEQRRILRLADPYFWLFGAGRAVA